MTFQSGPFSYHLYASFQALNSTKDRESMFNWLSQLLESLRQIACDTILKHRNDTKPWESEFCHIVKARRCSKHCWLHSVLERPGAWHYRQTGRGVRIWQFSPKLLNLCCNFHLSIEARYTTDDGKEYFHNARNRELCEVVAESGWYSGASVKSMQSAVAYDRYQQTRRSGNVQAGMRRAFQAIHSLMAWIETWDLRVG